jgi:NAD(P)-dependent dehydrogenase (short-subunit alcohol dehydrogenase family)
MGRRAAVLGADFNDVDAALRLAESALDFLGGMDCLVNNAGVTLNRPFLKMEPGQLDILLNVNFRTPYLLTQRLVAPRLKQGRGVICNPSSIHGLQGTPERD